MRVAIPKSLRLPRITARNRQIYEQVAVVGKSQRVVAAESGLSQPRVCAIVKRVGKWLQLPLPPGLDEGNRVARLQEQSRAHRMRLKYYLNQANEAWLESTRPQTTETVIRDPEGNVIKVQEVKKPSLGNPKYLATALMFTEALLAFDGMSAEGEVDLAPEGRLPEPAPLSRAEAVQEYRAFTQEMTPIVEQWEAKERAETPAELSCEAPIIAAPVAEVPAEKLPGPSEVPEPLSNLLSPVETANHALEITQQPVIESLSSVIELLSAPAPEPAAPPTEPIKPESPFRWLWPSMKLVVDDNPQRHPRLKLLPPRIYPTPEHSYDTRTGKRIEPRPHSRE